MNKTLLLVIGVAIVLLTISGATALDDEGVSTAPGLFEKQTVSAAQPSDPVSDFFNLLFSFVNPDNSYYTVDAFRATYKEGVQSTGKTVTSYGALCQVGERIKLVACNAPGSGATSCQRLFTKDYEKTTSDDKLNLNIECGGGSCYQQSWYTTNIKDKYVGYDCLAKEPGIKFASNPAVSKAAVKIGEKYTVTGDAVATRNLNGAVIETGLLYYGSGASTYAIVPVTSVDKGACGDDQTIGTKVTANKGDIITYSFTETVSSKVQTKAEYGISINAFPGCGWGKVWPTTSYSLQVGTEQVCGAPKTSDGKTASDICVGTNVMGKDSCGNALNIAGTKTTGECAVVVPVTCGNGVVDAGEECDGTKDKYLVGGIPSTGYCSSQCTIVCKEGYVRQENAIGAPSCVIGGSAAAVVIDGGESSTQPSTTTSQTTTGKGIPRSDLDTYKITANSPVCSSDDNCDANSTCVIADEDEKTATREELLVYKAYLRSVKENAPLGSYGKTIFVGVNYLSEFFTGETLIERTSPGLCVERSKTIGDYFGGLLSWVKTQFGIDNDALAYGIIFGGFGLVLYLLMALTSPRRY